MRKKALCCCIMLLLFPCNCRAFKPGDIAEKLDELGLTGSVEDFTGISLENLSSFLNWDKINMSLSADMHNTTDMLGRKALVTARVQKLGLRGIRIDARSDVHVPRADKPIRLSGFHMLRFPLKDRAYLVLPARKTYMKLDPERSRELMGELWEELNENKAEIDKREILGEESLQGYLCKKARILMTLHNGTKVDSLAWLAEDLKGFPLKIVADYTTPQGLTGSNTTVFSNIEKIEPDEGLFEIPEGYRRCENFVQLLSGGKIGSRLNKPKKKGKLFRK